MPVHFRIALQPSTQSCRVIWVRDGIARNSANGRDEAWLVNHDRELYG
jgi:hypothetical protein